jgi:hypothetical protein
MPLLMDLDEERTLLSAAAPLDLHPRDISDVQMRRFEDYAAEMFTAFGMELDSPATADTPRRFVRAAIPNC